MLIPFPLITSRPEIWVFGEHGFDESLTDCDSDTFWSQI